MSFPPLKSSESAIGVKTAPESPQSAETDVQTSLYRVVWRWHFYAGLFVAPILLVAAATGALYVFEAELAAWLYEDLYFVEPTGERLSYDEQWKVAQQAAGGEELEYLTIWPDARHSTRFVTHAHDADTGGAEPPHRAFFVDPYTGKLLGTRIVEREFFNAVLDLHRTLFAGPTGRILVELATSWGLVLLLTGAYLWWPRGKNRVWGVWLPRLRAKPYVVLRDLHAVCGVYTLAFAAILLATGLFVSQIWGAGYTWTSAQAGQSLGEFFAPAKSQPPVEGAPPASLERAVTSVLEHRRPGDLMSLLPAPTPELSYKAYLTRDGDTNTVRGYDIDQYTGETISITETAELEPMVRVLALAISLHVGKTFGMPSKVVAFATCLALIAMVVTGVWMWWKRRPRGTLGLPRKPEAGSTPKWVWALVALVGVALPTVGASILLILLGDWLFRRISRSFRAA
jgi:uncharacterized iron-regulated membrane protein